MSRPEVQRAPGAVAPLAATTVAARVAFALCVLVTLVFALSPPSARLHLFSWDKADHFASFLAITFTAIVAFPRVRGIWIGLAASGLGGAIELLQALPVVNRDCDVRDWAADSAAVALVLVLVWLARWLRRRSDLMIC